MHMPTFTSHLEVVEEVHPNVSRFWLLAHFSFSIVLSCAYSIVLKRQHMGGRTTIWGLNLTNRRAWNSTQRTAAFARRRSWV
jgi:uncharacterized membrane protein YagU involved in acid resistance